jgi:hypothetical protein
MFWGVFTSGNDVNTPAFFVGGDKTLQAGAGIAVFLSIVLLCCRDISHGLVPLFCGVALCGGQ